MRFLERRRARRALVAAALDMYRRWQPALKNDLDLSGQFHPDDIAVFINTARDYDYLTWRKS